MFFVLRYELFVKNGSSSLYIFYHPRHPSIFAPHV